MSLDPVDIEAIRALAYRVSYGHDLGDPDLVVASFTPDGRVLGASSLAPDRAPAAVATGSAEIRTWAADGYARCQGRARHLTLNELIDGAGDHATMRSYLVVLMTGWAPEAGVVLTARYEDRLVRVDGRWLIAERVAIVDPTPGQGADGVTDPPMLLLLQRGAAERPSPGSGDGAGGTVRS